MSSDRKIMAVLDGGSLSPPPVWMMRQAGRYLPEYRQTRREAGSFLDLCYTPELACEVTLQPIRRYAFDAAILFSDILVLPDALGQDVRFEEGLGPVLDPIDLTRLDRLDSSHIERHLEPVLETVRLLRQRLPGETTLLGFCGAPWTVATYMVAGRSSPDQAEARRLAHIERAAFDRLIDILVEGSIRYLARQLEEGADAVQIFDTWAGVLDEDSFDRLSVQPTRRIVEGVKEAVPGARIIGFPKGVGPLLDRYVSKTGVDAVGLDWTVPLELARHVQTSVPVQGNLDPMRLLAGGSALDEGVDRIMDALASGPFIFNLGHGITPQTPVDHVTRMINRVRGRGA